MTQQITDTILMVRPKHFGYDEETASNNAFQTNDQSLTPLEVEAKAIEEFDQFVQKLRSAGIDILVIQDTDHPKKLDAVFPNNWFSTHSNGVIATYPLQAPNRRAERREAILDELASQFKVSRRIQLEHWENQDHFLESTGSMIMDRPNQLVYACRSVRTSEKAFAEFCQKMDLKGILFDAVDHNNIPIYHTNVMMAIGETFAILVKEAIIRQEEQKEVLESLAHTGKELIELSIDQMLSFAGNMLQVRSKTGQSYLVMSSQAFSSLKTAQIEQIERHTSILHSPIPTLETYGGGSVRCMMAEIFLEKREY